MLCIILLYILARAFTKFSNTSTHNANLSISNAG